MKINYHLKGLLVCLSAGLIVGLLMFGLIFLTAYAYQ